MAIKNSEIAERLKGIRLLSDVSVAEMASQLNISESEYLAFENGDLQINVSILLDACEYLKISMTELLTGEPAKLHTYSICLLYTSSGIMTAKDSLSPLLGQAPDLDFVKDVENTVLAHDEVVGIHDLIVHDY